MFSDVHKLYRFISVMIYNNLDPIYTFMGVGVILGKNQLDYWKLENPTSSKLEKWGCIPWNFTCWKIFCR